MKKIVIAPDLQGEPVRARGRAGYRAGFRQVFPAAEYVLVPVADGGEGTVDAMVAATGGSKQVVAVSGPLGEPVEALDGLTGDGVDRSDRDGGGQRPGAGAAGFGAIRW